MDNSIQQDGQTKRQHPEPGLTQEDGLSEAALNAGFKRLMENLDKVDERRKHRSDWTEKYREKK